MEDKTTIKQIAQMAGVHRSTVDKVLHDRPGVSPDVRSKIKSIIDALGYKPNAIGKALKYQEKRQVIAAVCLHVCSEGEIKEGILRAQKEFGVFGYDVEFYYTDFTDIDGQVRILEMLFERGVAGVVLQALFSEKVSNVIAKLMGRGIPVVLVNSDLPDSGHLCYVGQDYYTAARTAARLTKELFQGQGKVAIINGSYDLMYGNHERSNEYVKYLNTICPRIEIVEIVGSQENEVPMFKSTLDLLSRRKDIDCLYVTTGGIRGVGQAIKVADMSQHIKVICYDLFPEIIELIHEGTVVATICQGLVDQGYRSFKTIVDYLFYGESPGEKNLFTETEIRIRENAPKLPQV